MIISRHTFQRTDTSLPWSNIFDNVSVTFQNQLTEFKEYRDVHAVHYTEKPDEYTFLSITIWEEEEFNSFIEWANTKVNYEEWLSDIKVAWATLGFEFTRTLENASN